ncbi:MAG: hypothetical protein GF315_06555 [candidate division Zixibacteria bacterium]|nr:hypothetical protein [candidate division Zixibacteria bacterium]
MIRLIKEISISLLIAMIVAFFFNQFVLKEVNISVQGVVINGESSAGLDTTFVQALASDSVDIFAVNLKELGQSAAEIYGANSVSLRRTPDMRIEMSVMDERPVLWVKSDHLVAISSTGRIINSNEVSRGVDMPVYIGKLESTLVPGDYCSDKHLQYSLAFLQVLSRLDSSFTRYISTIKLNSESGIMITIIPSEIPATLGFSDYGYRILKLRSVMEYVHGLERQPEVIDVRYGNFVRLIYNSNESGVG